MHVYRKYRIPVSLTADQKSEIRRLQDGQRAAYNWAVSHLRNGWNPNDEYGLSVRFTPHRRGWMRDVPRAMQNVAMQDAFAAAKSVLRRGSGDLAALGYRQKKARASLKCALAPVVTDSYVIKLPRFGTVRAKIPNEIMEHEPRSYEFVPYKGKYMLYVSCRVEVPAPRRGGMTYKGIDRGVAEPTVVATVSPDGRPLAKDSYDTTSDFKKNRAWNSQMRRKMSKQNKRPKRYRDNLRRLGKKMRKVLNRRTYAECVAAKHIVQDGRPGTIILEDLKLSKMTSHGGAHKKAMNREMRFVRHHMIEQRIKNRAEVEGVHILHVKPHHTSQTCSRCGHRDKKSRITRDMFKCVSCNYVQQADANAAITSAGAGCLRRTCTASRRGQEQPSSDANWTRAATVLRAPIRGRESQSSACFPPRSGSEKNVKNAVASRSRIRTSS